MLVFMRLYDSPLLTGPMPLVCGMAGLEATGDLAFTAALGFAVVREGAAVREEVVREGVEARVVVFTADDLGLDGLGLGTANRCVEAKLFSLKTAALDRR